MKKLLPFAVVLFIFSAVAVVFYNYGDDMFPEVTSVVAVDSISSADTVIEPVVDTVMQKRVADLERELLKVNRSLRNAKARKDTIFVVQTKDTLQ